MWVRILPWRHPPPWEDAGLDCRMARTRGKGRTARRELDRERLERSAELYLQTPFRTRSAVRVDEFAAYLRRARPHVSRIVQDLTGMSARDFLREKQLAHAQLLLRTTPAPVEQVALASGFGTAWTFYRCFKAAFGMTPAEYRERVTKCE